MNSVKFVPCVPSVSNTYTNNNTYTNTQTTRSPTLTPWYLLQPPKVSLRRSLNVFCRGEAKTQIQSEKHAALTHHHIHIHWSLWRNVTIRTRWNRWMEHEKHLHGCSYTTANYNYYTNCVGIFWCFLFMLFWKMASVLRPIKQFVWRPGAVCLFHRQTIASSNDQCECPQDTQSLTQTQNA